VRQGRIQFLDRSGKFQARVEQANQVDPGRTRAGIGLQRSMQPLDGVVLVSLEVQRVGLARQASRLVDCGLRRLAS